MSLLPKYYIFLWSKDNIPNTSYIIARNSKNAVKGMLRDAKKGPDALWFGGAYYAYLESSYLGNLLVMLVPGYNHISKGTWSKWVKNED